MGKGGPLAFLNKKTWHPGNARNQEEVWKREQQFLKEIDKREELKKQIQEEREKEEFDRIAGTSAKVKKAERLEWMYQGGFAAQEDAAKRKEEYLLGKHAELPAGEETVSRVDQIAHAASETAEQVLDNANESWARLNADPLLWMKRQEQGKVKSITSNPYMMMQLKEKAKALKSAKKKDKKDKKDKKESKKSSRSHHPRRSPSPDTISHRYPSPPAKRSRHSESHQSPRPSCSHGPDNRSTSRSCHAPDSEHAPRQHNGVSRRRDDEAEHKSRRSDGRSDSVPNRSYGDRRHDRDVSHRSGHVRTSREHSPRDRDHVGMSNGPRRRGADTEVAERTDAERGAPNEYKKAGYGLRESHIPEHVLKGRESLADVTKKRLEDGARERARADEEARQRRSQHVVYKTGKLTNEEKAARRAEMLGNAAELDSHRHTRLEVAHHEAQVDAASCKPTASRADAFLSKAQQDVLLDDTTTLEGRIQRNKGKLQR